MGKNRGKLGDVADRIKGKENGLKVYSFSASSIDTKVDRKRVATVTLKFRLQLEEGYTLLDLNDSTFVILQVEGTLNQQ